MYINYNASKPQVEYIDNDVNTTELSLLIQSKHYDPLSNIDPHLNTLFKIDGNLKSHIECCFSSLVSLNKFNKNKHV